MCDSKGLVTTTRGDELPKHKQVMARKDKDTPNMKDLKDVVAFVKPHAIVGLTGGGEAWGKVRKAAEKSTLCFLAVDVTGSWFAVILSDMHHLPGFPPYQVTQRRSMWQAQTCSTHA